jgi:hypothetical protein
MAKANKKTRFTMQFTAKQPEYSVPSSKRAGEGSMLNLLA